MKNFRTLQMALLTSIVVVAVSCGPSRESYYTRYPAPPPRTSLSLVISPWPGIVISNYPDGRYYYRSPEGYIYWRGYDNRYYLDRTYIGKAHYEQREYNEWRDNGRRYNNGRRRHH
ncbi:MAG: hypothetical protein ACHQEB_06140 [Chitinophagales bacterium]